MAINFLNYLRSSAADPYTHGPSGPDFNSSNPPEMHDESLVAPPRKKRSWVLYGAAITAIGGAMLLAASRASTVPTTAITIDGTRAGNVTYGVGAISGGGGNSRLLIDYPEPQRTQVLDYMFKPNYGASLQMLKLEIGGDANSTDGTEPSMEHSKGQINCNNGYEWWMAKQAVARNPSIKLYGLQWAAPGWTGEGGTTIWTQSNVNYVIDWMNCAKQQGLTISYLGGWNERGFNTTWYENLRTALDNAGYTGTKIIAADQPNNTAWSEAPTIANDSTLKADIGLLGDHDVCQYPTTGYICTTTSTAKGLGKPMWASELGAMDANANADAMVRSINQGYNQATLTGFLLWPLLDSMPAGLPHENFGLITADQPWSGNYNVNKMTWGIAQTTQFVPVGWRHVNQANKALGTTGSYNSYEAPDHSAWSLVAENTGTAAGQTLVDEPIQVTVQGGLPSSAVHVWATNLESSDPSQWFVQQADITPSNGVFNYTVPAGYVVTFTTTTGQSHGNPGTPPAAVTQALPYTNSLATDDGSNEPSLLAPQDGAFGIVPCLGGRAGNCTQQQVPAQPVYWNSHDGGYPWGTIGDGNWTNYTAQTDMLFTSTSGSGGVIGRFSNRGTGTVGTGKFNGYMLHVTESGNWQILKNAASTNAATVLRSGTVAALGTGKWHTLALAMNGSNITATLDGATLGTVTDTAYSAGAAGLEAGAFTANWPTNQYSNFSVTPLP